MIVYDNHAQEAFKHLLQENARLQQRIQKLEIEIVDKTPPTGFWNKLFYKKPNES